MVWDGCVEFCLLCFLLTIVGPWRASKPESWQSENYTLLVKNGHLAWSDPDNWHFARIGRHPQDTGLADILFTSRSFIRYDPGT